MSRPLAPALLLTLCAFAAGPPAAEPPAGGCGGSHVVVRGDTLYSIARRCRSTVVAIAEANRLNDPRRIEVGQVLRLSGPDVPFPFAKPEPGPAREAAGPYLFQPGDTLYSLARWARVGVGALIAANPGIDPQKMEIGDEIRLPAGAVRPEPARLRERGPPLQRAILRRYETLGPPPPRAVPTAPPPRAVPAPPPRRDKPEDEREPEGM